MDVTLENLKSFDSVYNAINFATSQYPNKPKKPIITIHTAKEAADYAVKLLEYENRYTEHCSSVDEINKIITEYIKILSGFYVYVPEQYQEKVYDNAYINGHSSGYFEIYLKLLNLVKLFK